MCQHSFAEYCVHAYLPEPGSNYQLPCCSATTSSSVKLLPTSSGLSASSPWHWQDAGIAGAFLLLLDLLVCWMQLVVLV